MENNQDIFEMMKNAKELHGEPQIVEGETEMLLSPEKIKQIEEMGKQDPRYQARERGEEVFVDVEKQKETSKEYSGSGLVVQKKEKKTQDGVEIGLTEEGKAKIDKRSAELDDEIKEAKEKAEKAKAQYEANKKKKEEVQNIDELSEEEYREKVQQAVVLIDKTKMGSIINFTDEERAKLEKVESIKLEEIENIKIPVKKEKKLNDKNKFKKLIKGAAIPFTAHIVLPCSGYTCEISACSTYEILTLTLSDKYRDNTSNSLRERWSIIYSHIVNTSIGNFNSFDLFAHNTCALDYETFLYGILSATYGGSQKDFPMDCECKNSFQYTDDVKNFMRAERMSPKLVELFTGIADNSAIVERAIEYRKQHAPLLDAKVITLPYSKFRVYLQIQSVYDVINDNSGLLEERYKEEKDMVRENIVKLVRTITKIAIDDPEDETSEYKIEDPEEKVDVVYQLSSTDTTILEKYINDMVSDKQIEYGAVDIVCPKCHKVTKYLPMPIESMLFFLVGQDSGRAIL